MIPTMMRSQDRVTTTVQNTIGKVWRVQKGGREGDGESTESADFVALMPGVS